MVIEHKGVDVQLDGREAWLLGGLAHKIMAQYEHGSMPLNDAEMSLVNGLTALKPEGR